MLGLQASLPYILGSEGSGTIAACGTEVTGFKTGDRVFTAGFLNPPGGFYAEYTAIDEQYVARIPDGYELLEANVISGVGITALRGLVDVLRIREDEKEFIMGASGGVGPIAVQLASRLGSRVCALASGADGVELIRSLGVEDVFNGKGDTCIDRLQESGCVGFDKALLTAGF